MAFAQAVSIFLSYGDRDILKDVTISIGSGDRIALTGANGSGKSSLMKIIAGTARPDAGSVSVSRDSIVSYLPQSGIIHSGLSLHDEAEKAFDRIRALELSLEELGKQLSDHTDETSDTVKLLERYHDLQVKIEASGFYFRRERIEQILSGLGFTKQDVTRRTEEFSGGWQMRIALAKVLLENPDIMLLDEPTNYLDLETTSWLTEFLSSYRGGILVVSHDRYFLDSTVRDVAELFTGRIRKYHGTFTDYTNIRSAELKSLLDQYERQQEEISRIEDFIDRFRYNASKAQLVQSRIKQLEKVERIEIPETMKRMHFSFPPPPHCGRMVLNLESLTKSYGSFTVFNDLSLEIERGEKIVIAGRNGAGKSSLMRIIAGIDQNFTGNVIYGKDVKLGYFSQEQDSALDGSHTVIEEIESVAPTDLFPRLRNLLGSFLFSGDDIHKRISVLSGGEKSRLSLLKLLLRPVNLLVLDEPTNHLDMHSKDVLLEALTSYPGTVVFVSHDRHFIDGLATKVLALEENGPRLYFGNYSYYHWKKEQTDTAETVSAVNLHPAKTGSAAPVQTLSISAASREEQKRIKAEIRKFEREEDTLMLELEKLEQEHAELQVVLSLPDVYTDGERIRATMRRIEDNEIQQKKASERWQELEPVLRALRLRITDQIS